MRWQRLWRWVASGVLVASWLAATPFSGAACSCADESVAADVVFVGRVVVVADGERVRRWLRVRPHGFGSTVALLTVERVWQGPSRPIFTVIGGTGQGDCALDFVPGSTYLVYGRGPGSGPLETNTCGGSRLMEHPVP